MTMEIIGEATCETLIMNPATRSMKMMMTMGIMGEVTCDTGIMNPGGRSMTIMMTMGIIGEGRSMTIMILRILETIVFEERHTGTLTSQTKYLKMRSIQET